MRKKLNKCKNLRQPFQAAEGFVPACTVLFSCCFGAISTCMPAGSRRTPPSSRGGIVLFIYLICIVINFFVPSGSAEAFLLIPIIVPLAGAFGVSAQLSIVAYAYGDGFSNIIYPTNVALIIALGLAGCSYGKWVKYSLPFQLLNLLLISGMLLLGVAIGYA